MGRAVYCEWPSPTSSSSAAARQAAQEKQPGLGAATKQVRVTLTALLKAESEAARGRRRRAARCRLDEKLRRRTSAARQLPGESWRVGCTGRFTSFLRKDRKRRDTADGGVRQVTRQYSRLLADCMRYASEEDTRRAAWAYREAIAPRPDKPVVPQPRCSACQLGALRGGSAAVP